VISPATVDLLLQTAQNALPSRAQDQCSVSAAVSVKQLVLMCLTRLVHIIHSAQPEQVNKHLLILSKAFTLDITDSICVSHCVG